MESIRGQAYSKIQTGLSSSDLTDPISSTVAGLRSCTGSSPAQENNHQLRRGAVHAWINPHTGTIAASATTNNVPYTWATYITNDCPTVSTPARR